MLYLEVLRAFFQILQEFEEKFISLLEPRIQRVAKLFLHNEQGSPLTQMHVQPGLKPEHKTLGAIVVHTAVVLSFSHQQSFLLPFVNMFANPGALAVSFTDEDTDIINCPQFFRKLTCQPWWMTTSLK